MEDYSSLINQIKKVNIGERLTPDFCNLLTEFRNKGLFYNPEFLSQLMASLSNINLLPYIRRSFLGTKPTREQLLDYCNLVSKIDLGVMLSLARSHGYPFLHEIPQTNPHLIQLIEQGIQKDNFRSLTLLPVDEIVANSHLIVKAYRKGGFERLNKYLRFSLKPERTRHYYTNGEEKEYSIFDKRYLEVQTQLKEDPKIISIFEQEKLKLENNNKK